MNDRLKTVDYTTVPTAMPTVLPAMLLVGVSKTDYKVGEKLWIWTWECEVVGIDYEGKTLVVRFLTGQVNGLIPAGSEIKRLEQQ